MSPLESLMGQLAFGNLGPQSGGLAQMLGMNRVQGVPPPPQIPQPMAQRKNKKVPLEQQVAEVPSNETIADIDQYNKTLASETAKADLEYQSKLAEREASTLENARIYKEARRLNKSGKTGKIYEKFFEQAGFPGLTSKERREMAVLQKQAVAPTLRATLGSQFTGKEFDTLMNASFSPDYPEETNDAILDNLERAKEISMKEFQIARRLRKDNKGRTPSNYNARVMDELSEFVQEQAPQIRKNVKMIINGENGVPKGKTLMYSSTGKELWVPDNEAAIKHVLSLGGSLP